MDCKFYKGFSVYKKGDSRSYVMKRYSKDLAEKKGRMSLFEIAETIEKTVKAQKGLFPNVDFYPAIVYLLLKIPPELADSILAIGRIPGWCAHRPREN